MARGLRGLYYFLGFSQSLERPRHIPSIPIHFKGKVACKMFKIKSFIVDEFGAGYKNVWLEAG